MSNLCLGTWRRRLPLLLCSSAARVESNRPWKESCRQLITCVMTIGSPKAARKEVKVRMPDVPAWWYRTSSTIPPCPQGSRCTDTHCRLQHPLCLRGESCRDPDCAFSHPTLASKENKTNSLVVVGREPQEKKGPDFVYVDSSPNLSCDPCPFGKWCRNTKCTKKHPNCPYGVACANSSCRLFHPPKLVSVPVPVLDSNASSHSNDKKTQVVLKGQAKSSTKVDDVPKSVPSIPPLPTPQNVSMVHLLGIGRSGLRPTKKKKRTKKKAKHSTHNKEKDGLTAKTNQIEALRIFLKPPPLNPNKTKNTSKALLSNRKRIQSQKMKIKNKLKKMQKKSKLQVIPYMRTHQKELVRPFLKKGGKISPANMQMQERVLARAKRQEGNLFIIRKLRHKLDCPLIGS